jgi:hypothetical protein
MLETLSIQSLLIPRRWESNNAMMQSISRKGFYCKNQIMEQSWLKNIDPKDGYYIAGFTDGEGSFNVSLKKRNDYAGEWKITASFNISQKDRVILSWIKNILGCGTLRERKDGVVYYEVTNVASLKEKIIPFFIRFNFISSIKKTNFSIFKQIVEHMSERNHLTKEGFEKVLQLRETLNEGKGRKRKYALSDVIKVEESSETIRKTLEDTMEPPTV